MDAKHVFLLKLLKDASQFIIPIYQRKYSWDIEQCDRLWDDIHKAGENENTKGLFIGSIVYIADNDSHNSPLLVIDGQQRLTTITLLLIALAKALGDKEPFQGFSNNKIRNYYLVNEHEENTLYNRLVLTEADHGTLNSLVKNTPLPRVPSLRIKTNYDFFENKLADLTSAELEVICRGLAKLLIVYVALSPREDNPQLIFESMNSTGLKLTQADLIRNYVLMGLKPDIQTELYKNYWQPMEDIFLTKTNYSELNTFVRHYLTIKTSLIPKIDSVYDEFKKFFPFYPEQSPKELLADILKYAQFYNSMALNGETEKQLAEAFSDLRELKVDTAYPFLLQLYNDYKENILNKTDFIEAVRLIESYIFRRTICAIPPNFLNKFFASLYEKINKNNYLESLELAFAKLVSYQRFPLDTEFKQEFVRRDLYNFRNRSYWLRRLENYGHKEYIALNDFTIEHIMPQSQPLPDSWQSSLGHNWKNIQNSLLHTAGNLTLTGYNSKYSNRAFIEKRDMENGFAESPLTLNKGLGKVTDWTAEEIAERGARLAERAVKVWKGLNVTQQQIETYKPSQSVTSSYSIDDYPLLKNTDLGMLFKALKSEILSLDENISIDFLKRYIAFKADSNFVDVIPQSKQLILSLKIDFQELDDPRHICKNVENIGHWGNGNVEAKFNSLDQLTYVVGLIRQALEKQLIDNS